MWVLACGPGDLAWRPGGLEREELSRPADGSRPRLVLWRARAVDPVVAADGAAILVFAGELHNRRELEREHGELPSPTPTDAALILESFRRRGEAAFGTLRGVFSLVVWDRRRELLVCARDQVGLHPLYFSVRDEAILVSPCLETLRRHPGVDPALDRLAVASYLAYDSSDKQETFFEKVRRLPPGHAMRWQRGEPRISRYWDPAPPSRPVRWIDEDRVAEFEPLFEQAVERCLDPVQSGIFLSGGLDSVSVATLAARCARKAAQPPPVALSIAFPDPAGREEEKVQRGVAEALALEQVMIPFDTALGPSNQFETSLALSAHLSLPLINSWLPAYVTLVSAGLERGCGTILTGNGGDEWLGLTPNYAAELLRRADLAGLLRHLKSRVRSFDIPPHIIVWGSLWRFGARPLLKRGFLSALAALAANRAGAPLARPILAARRRRAARLLESRLPAWLAPDAELRRALVERAVERQTALAVSDSVYLEDLRLSLDHATVSHEFEQQFDLGHRLGFRYRHPLFDADLVDFLFRTPPELIDPGGRSKGLIRELVSRSLPGLGFERQKKVPAGGYWVGLFVPAFSRLIEATGGAPALSDLGIVDGPALAALAPDSLLAEHGREAHRVWHTLSVEAWARPRS